MKNQVEVEPINTTMVTEYEGKAVSMTQLISSLKIVDQATYETAVNYRKTLKAMEKDVDASRKTIVNPLNAAKDAIQALFNPILMRLDNSKRHVEGLIDSYEIEQERIRRAKEEELRKKAEAEEKRQRELKEKQEREWREKEEKAKAEQRLLEKQIADAKNEKAKAELEAKQAKAKAEEEKAARIAEQRAQEAQEVQVVAPVVPSSVQKVEGTSTREIWSAEVVDMMELVKSVAEGKAPIGWLQVNQVAINKQASATKDSLKFPGLKFNVKRTQVDKG